MKSNGNEYNFETKEELYEFLYGYCTREEREEIMRRLGQLIVEGE